MIILGAFDDQIFQCCTGFNNNETNQLEDSFFVVNFEIDFLFIVVWKFGNNEMVERHLAQ